MIHRRIRHGLLLAALALASTAQAADSLKIGFLTTLSGPGAAIGQEVRDGFLLGLRHSGGTFGGVPVELNIADDQQNPETGRQAVERFVKRDKADIVTGIVFSNVLLPVLPAILGSDTVYLSTNSGPAEYAGGKCNKNFFAVAWQNEDIPAAMGKYATDRQFKRVALIAPNYPGGRESLGGFKRLFRGQVVEEIYTKLGQLDYAAELATLRAAAPDAVFFFLPGAMGVNFIKQYQGAGLASRATLLAPGFSADEDTIKAVGDALVGTYNASQWAADLPNAANRKFVDDFKATYGRMPSLYASQGYDTALLVDSAVKAAGNRRSDPVALRDALRRADFQSVRGGFKFNNNQYPIQSLHLRVVEKDATGRVGNKFVSTLLADHADPFVAECAMK
ncbi:ABC transporter substrate-binding protein [Variovorax sp. J31P207]|uniref:ABC transporter substrate-binding protein n=1 Tax=Variovorax sp. J31P207 TaxID=3053510 RepID=UPI002575CA5E|nr:ABC transporter substrate-binding protein [Variovorax sp. J31P207]MDM0068238.1 ABC transporter substrate-binding protein [Variovorax sp. J31P207]